MLSSFGFHHIGIEYPSNTRVNVIITQTHPHSQTHIYIYMDIYYLFMFNIFKTMLSTDSYIDVAHLVMTENQCDSLMKICISSTVHRLSSLTIRLRCVLTKK